MSYAFGLNARGELQQIYWGGRLGANDAIPQARPMPEAASFDPSYSTTPQEYAGWGSGLFVEPALKMTFADGNRDLRNHQWNARGRHFIQLRADGDHPRVRFDAEEGDGSSVEYGPFDEVHWTDGAMYADGRLLATFDDATQQWMCTATRRVFPVMVLVSEEERTRGAH